MVCYVYEQRENIKEGGMKIESTDKKKVFTLDGHILNAVRVDYYGRSAQGIQGGQVIKQGWELQYQGITLTGRKCDNSSYGFHAEFETLGALVEDIQYCNDDYSSPDAFGHEHTAIHIFLKRIAKVDSGDRRV